MTISQAEARRLRKRVEQLESMERTQRGRYARQYPGGVNIAQSTFNAATDFLPAVIDNSRKLGHAVVVVADGATLLYYALPHPDQQP
jgi:hypothetical protein